MTWSLLGSGRSGYINIVFNAMGLPWRIQLQSLGGISHNKVEDTSEEHLEMAVRAFDRLAKKTMQWIQAN